VYVQESIRSQFVEAFKAGFQGILSKAGDPVDPSTTHGPQADVLQHRHVLRFLEGAKADGLTAGIGGDRLGDKGYFIQPTIFFDASSLLPPTAPDSIADQSQAPETHDIVKKEIFGPVVVLNSFKDEDEVLAKANDTEFGLYASVFTKDINRALKFAKRMEAGSVGVNCTSPTVGFDMPFGGFKQSGDGRQWGRAGVESWLQVRCNIFLGGSGEKLADLRIDKVGVYQPRLRCNMAMWRVLFSLSWNSDVIHWPCIHCGQSVFS
jgi:aldehyde dehydrogenase (NAD+)